MRVELLVLPFICTASLAVLVPLPCVRRDVATLSFVAWLLVCNSIHGINAVVWAGNTDEHVPAWCDLVTKLILGAMMALPASCLCIMQRLEHAASARPLPPNSKASRNRLVIEISLCVAAPALFMLWHLFFQNHRFDILQDYGCAASVYPSAVSAIMWLPPLVCCILTLILGGIIIRRTHRASAVDFSQHIVSRLSISSSHFFRRLTITFLLVALLFVLILFCLFTGASNASVSWDLIHADFNVIHVVSSSDDPSIAVIWWGIRILSFVYVLLSASLGDARDAAKRIRSRTPSESSFKSWSLQKLKSNVPSLSSGAPKIPKPRPVSLDLKSGWDEMLDRPSPLRNLFTPSSTPSRSKSLTSPCRTPTPGPFPSCSRTPSPMKNEDEAFLESTLAYLGSPTAHALGLNTPIVPVPPVHKPRRLPSRSSPVKQIKQLPCSPTPESKRMSGISAISSVFDALWPQPPESPSPPLSRTPSPYAAATSGHARADSVDTVSQFIPPGLVFESEPFLETPPVSRGSSLPERKSLRTVRGQWNKNGLSAHEDVIYETSGPELV